MLCAAQAVWYLKCRALTMVNWIDDTDFEEEGVAEVLLDEYSTATLPRPGTSLTRPMTQANAPGVPGQGMRPMSSSGRPLSGFARPGTGSARPPPRTPGPPLAPPPPKKTGPRREDRGSECSTGVSTGPCGA